MGGEARGGVGAGTDVEVGSQLGARVGLEAGCGVEAGAAWVRLRVGAGRWGADAVGRARLLRAYAVVQQEGEVGRGQRGWQVAGSCVNRVRAVEMLRVLRGCWQGWGWRRVVWLVGWERWRRMGRLGRVCRQRWGWERWCTCMGAMGDGEAGAGVDARAGVEVGSGLEAGIGMGEATGVVAGAGEEVGAMRECGTLAGALVGVATGMMRERWRQLEGARTRVSSLMLGYMWLGGGYGGCRQRESSCWVR